MDKTIYISHVNCIGKSCTCESIASFYLSDRVVDVNFRSELNNLSEPFLCLVMDKGRINVYQGINRAEMFQRDLQLGFFYSIKDFQVSRCVDDYDNEIKQLKSLRLDSEFQFNMCNLSHVICEKLRLKLIGWPHRDAGYGVTLLKNSNGGRIAITPKKVLQKGDVVSTPCRNKIDDRSLVTPEKSLIDKPKNAVTAFNYFIKDCFKMSEALKHRNVSNHERNKELGVRWRSLTSKEKEKYQSLAQKDKARYKRELNEYNIFLTRMNLSPEFNRPVTAYNHFIHQEKQFISELGIVDSGKSMGQHGSSRWHNMTTGEKNLYETIRQCDASIEKKKV